MLASLGRPVAVILSTVVLAACAGGGSSMTPRATRATNSKQTTPASFTIQWTNAKASAAVRKADSISPSAQSVTVTINGTPSAVANRNTSPTQTIPLIAPVGNDQFIFNVYDGQNGQGHLLGSATVQQLIVDGAANTVTAVIQATCSETNVTFANNEPLAYATYTAPQGLVASTLQSIVIAGQSAALLNVEPEDIDGNVIIAGTAGKVAYTFSGSAAYIQPVDGAHLDLTPTSGARTTTPSTLTLAAPTCPSTTVAVEASPAIYVEINNGFTYRFDWYGDFLGGGSLASGDALIGYAPATHSMMAYNKSSGAVNAYSLDLSSHTTLYTIQSHCVVTWSNYLQSVFAANVGKGMTEYFTYNGGTVPITNLTTNLPTAIAASTMSGSPYAFSGSGSTIQAFNLSVTGGGAYTGSGTATGPIVSLATDDNDGAVFSFDSGGAYVDEFAESNVSSVLLPSNLGLLVTPAVGSLDTDGLNFYEVGVDQSFYGSTFSGSQLTGGDFISPLGTGLAIAVISSNEQ